MIHKYHDQRNSSWAIGPVWRAVRASRNTHFPRASVNKRQKKGRVGERSGARLVRVSSVRFAEESCSTPRPLTFLNVYINTNRRDPDGNRPAYVRCVNHPGTLIPATEGRLSISLRI